MDVAGAAMSKNPYETPGEAGVPVRQSKHEIRRQNSTLGCVIVGILGVLAGLCVLLGLATYFLPVF